jgi:hypothetical protein
MRAVRVTDDLVLMDREALAQWTHRSVHTIRAKCAVHSYAADGRAMYDAHECAKTLDGVAQSGRHAA